MLHVSTRPISERFLDLAERHDEYLREGRRLRRRLGLALPLAGIGVFATGLAVVVIGVVFLAGNVFFHWFR